MNFEYALLAPRRGHDGKGKSRLSEPLVIMSSRTSLEGTPSINIQCINIGIFAYKTLIGRYSKTSLITTPIDQTSVNVPTIVKSASNSGGLWVIVTRSDVLE